MRLGRDPWVNEACERRGLKYGTTEGRASTAWRRSGRGEEEGGVVLGAEEHLVGEDGAAVLLEVEAAGVDLVEDVLGGGGAGRNSPDDDSVMGVKGIERAKQGVIRRCADARLESPHTHYILALATTCVIISTVTCGRRQSFSLLDEIVGPR